MALYDKVFEAHPVAIGKAISKAERQDHCFILVVVWLYRGLFRDLCIPSLDGNDSTSDGNVSVSSVHFFILRVGKAHHDRASTSMV